MAPSYPDPKLRRQRPDVKRNEANSKSSFVPNSLGVNKQNFGTVLQSDESFENSLAGKK
jgi:hypothetical protein